MFKKQDVLLHNSLWIALVCLVVQQLIVASSSIWLTRLILHISEGAPALIWLGLYLLSLILPYFPGALALIETAKAKGAISINYIQQFAKLYPGKIFEWSNHQEKKYKASIISGEAYPTLTGYVDYIYQLTASGLNVFFNLIAFAILINPAFFLSYIVGIVLAALILHFQTFLKEKLSNQEQQSRIKWLSLLLSTWDNVLLNNKYNLSIWNRNTNESGNNLIKSSVSLEKYSQMISIGMAFSLTLPSIILVVYLASTNIHDLPFLSILVVLLPRLFQVLTYSYELLLLLADLPMQRTKLNTVLGMLDVPEKADESHAMLERVDWEKITSALKNSEDSTTSISARELLQNLPKSGRIAIHGENGSGKTSLLMLLKMKHGENAFYLPYKHDLLFNQEKMKGSAGQISKQILEEIKTEIPAPIILLDEWDAHLDNRNRIEISLLIDQLAAKSCVVEVLHLKH